MSKDKHLVIIGPPGTGKTSKLTSIVRSFYKESGSDFLYISHTKAAAAEAMTRFGTGDSDFNVIGWVALAEERTSTLHSLCFRQIGASRAQTVDDGKLEPFMDQFGLDLDEGGEGRRYLEVISKARSTEENPVEVFSHRRDMESSTTSFASFYKSYNSWKHEFGYVDFTDMLERYLGVKKSLGLKLLAIDEAQDLTPLHWRVIRHLMLLNPFCRVVIAGDEDQTVYSFIGADSHGLHTFKDQFDADYHVLANSYRVPRLVHAVAQDVIGRVSDRVAILYEPRDAEGHYKHFADTGHITHNLQHGADKDNLILYSDRFVREDIEAELMADLIPFTVISGMPGPLDTRGGKALRMALQDWPKGKWEECRSIVRAGLSNAGAQIWDSIGYLQCLSKIQKRDLSMLRVPSIHWDYLSHIDFTQPVRTKLSTIHGAKGRESDIVHLCLAQSNSAYSQGLDDPDSTHRLFYVGATRARETLYTYEGSAYGYQL